MKQDQIQLRQYLNSFTKDELLDKLCHVYLELEQLRETTDAIETTIVFFDDPEVKN